MPILPAPSVFPAARTNPLRVFRPEPGDSSGEPDESVVAHPSLTDHRIVHELERLSEADDEYWAFRGRAARQQTHGLTQYPAMMVPAMQAVLVRIVVGVDERITTVLDPFAGSGTTLVECMRLGLNYAGQDINPLAVLLCRTKVGPFHIDGLASAVEDVLEQASADRSKRIEANFPRAGEVVLSQSHHRTLLHPTSHSAG